MFYENFTKTVNFYGNFYTIRGKYFTNIFIYFLIFGDG